MNFQKKLDSNRKSAEEFYELQWKKKIEVAKKELENEKVFILLKF